MDAILVSWSSRDAAFAVPLGNEEQAARTLSAGLAAARAACRPKAWSDTRQGRCLYFQNLHLRFYDGAVRASLYGGTLIAPARLFQWPAASPLLPAQRDAEARLRLRPGDDALCWDGAAAALAGAARYMAARDRLFATIRTVTESVTVTEPVQNKSKITE